MLVNCSIGKKRALQRSERYCTISTQDPIEGKWRRAAKDTRRELAHAQTEASELRREVPPADHSFL